MRTDLDAAQRRRADFLNRALTEGLPLEGAVRTAAIAEGFVLGEIPPALFLRQAEAVDAVTAALPAPERADEAAPETARLPDRDIPARDIPAPAVETEVEAVTSDTPASIGQVLSLAAREAGLPVAALLGTGRSVPLGRCRALALGVLCRGLGLSWKESGEAIALSASGTHYCLRRFASLAESDQAFRRSVRAVASALGLDAAALLGDSRDMAPASPRPRPPVESRRRPAPPVTDGALDAAVAAARAWLAENDVPLPEDVTDRQLLSRVNSARIADGLQPIAIPPLDPPAGRGLGSSAAVAAETA